MVREFKLPDVGEGVAEGEIVQWLVSEGDEVSEDQPVAEVETDKAVVEVPSPVDGSVKEILAEEGEVVPVGNVIITFAVEGEEEETAESEAPTHSQERVSEEPAEIGEEDETETPAGRTFAPPNVRRLARELGVDISSVSGSGPSGRVTEGDVREAAEGGNEETKGPKQLDEGLPSATRKAGEEGGSATGADTADLESADRDRTLAAPATRKLAEEEGVDLNRVPTDEERDGEAFVTPEAVRQYATAQREAQAADAAAVAESGTEASTGGEPTGSEERLPYRGIRRTIGRQMANSKFTAPHVSHHDTADVKRLVEARADLKDRAEDRGVKLTYMPFIMKAIVAALKEFPELNASLDEEAEEIVVKHYYNIGIAVATDAGLMVPVVRNVDEKGLLQLASEVNELAQKARERSISREEMQGGTFTITNFGAIGGEYATPIINHPEVGILGLGKLTERPVAEDGEVRAAHTLPLSLSIDHRVIDGAEAAMFANRVIEYLENPTLLLLE
ncbi:2-oxo acid dehydrogenase subunit E2 [Halalkalicoccus jeotgali]|uniref:Branched-chain alpha-keto acid dehydrogenase subunit E2 n=1 Tax=Halalkalicoccus jeotgali (strain DSM 18796 / CECT 7217 / JCM 14584 / KCTC 4019 / B3) TaxID=795797 RepID=D8J3S8_HALJB|nr:2-oxo acid dehydrogenase subunit E2 [Halalkalicoccus jeotgali]ADJ13419.1 branched-chain alpha-keto acid dehydrogenase subunit E2 [Halalkalicoccus jeotgali B3]ELY32749.1 branched-chain alpha-keto acid dehydrogenase subunit E2 [Halalkalicoccus jeotgali B3]